MLQDFARTLLSHAHGILAWYDHPHLTGPLEGTNNYIKTITCDNYGQRNQDFLKLNSANYTKPNTL